MNNKNYQMLSVLFVILSIAFLFGIVQMFTSTSMDGDSLKDLPLEEKNEEVMKEGISLANKVILMKTSLGDIEIELDFENAPVTSENFLNYVEAGHFDGLIFHRVIPGFMIQGGGFEQNGSQKATLDPIVLESNNGLKNLRGTIAMARTNDPNSATSQFFINTVDNSFLDYSAQNPGYAVFGKVVSGLEVIDSIEAVETSTNGYHGDWPVENVIIEEVVLK